MRREEGTEQTFPAGQDPGRKTLGSAVRWLFLNGLKNNLKITLTH